MVVIYWRDIPAQVNANAIATHQVLLPAPFQRAIDRAKRKAKIYTAQRGRGPVAPREPPVRRRPRRRGRRRGGAPRRRRTRRRASARSPSPAAGTTRQPMPDASEPRVVFTPSGLNGAVPVGHDGARRGAATRRRPRHGVRRARDLRPVPGERPRPERSPKWGITNDGHALERTGARSSTTTAASRARSPASRLGLRARASSATS